MEIKEDTYTTSVEIPEENSGAEVSRKRQRKKNK